MSGITTARPRFLVAALVVSLALNLCVLGGAVYSRWVGHPLPPPMPGRRLETVLEQLSLRPDQKAAFEEFRRSLRHEQETLAEADRPALGDAWEALTHDNPDQAKIQAALDQMALHRHAFQVNTTAATVRFMAVLTPEQREAVAHSVLDHRGPSDTLMRGGGR
jgi:Spy/CpxP family protein refolding chaperone